ncbi:MAG: glycosyltransferase [Lachnospiraceae bacterium]|nr:glycosyltransferase [Lachnospiraceae bacterium]
MVKRTLEQIREKRNTGELPLLTVVITAYNIKDYLERSIESVRRQSYHNLEIILVDDGSTDGSEVLCDNYALLDKRIRVIHKANGGPSEARNVAIEEAKGEYIAFVDGDDWVEEDMYENMYLAIKEWNAELAVCTYKEVSKRYTKDPSDHNILFFDKDEALESFIKEEEEVQIQNAAWNKLYKRQLLSTLRFPVGKLYEEIVFTTKLLHHANRVVYLNQAYYNYVVDRIGSIMNMGVNYRIFTDQIPLYLEKREYLLSIKRKDLVKIHNAFFYKRLLIHYMELEKNKPENYKIYGKQIRQIIKGERKYFREVLSSDIVSGNEKIKMKLFGISPKAFYYFTRFNEKYVIPQKQVLLSVNEPLVVIQLSGGLGNQMFQYALYLRLKAMGKKVKIDDKTDYRGVNKRPIRLGIFGIRYEVPTELEMLCLTDSLLDLASRIRRKLMGRRTAEYIEKNQLFDAKVLEIDRAYLVGCWQSEKYFEDIREEVRTAFVFNIPELAETMKDYERKIKESNSVCVHIRRGDYLEVSELYGGICTPEYYKKSMIQMEEWYPDCHFFVFTNDVSWVKHNYKQDNLTIVEGNDEDSGYIDMYLMTQCKHFILANSSFSWWGCYLSLSQEKKVIAPKQWFNGRDCRDIYTKEMQIID